MKDWYVVLISDLKSHVRESSFLLINLLDLLFLGLITAAFWPSGIIVHFERPLLGTVFSYALLAATVAINLLGLNEQYRFPRMQTLRAWIRYGNLPPRAAVVGKLLSRSLQGIFLLAATVPLGVMVLLVGGLSRQGVFLLYLLALLVANAGGWLGIYLVEHFTHQFRSIAVGLFLLYLLGMGISGFFPHPSLPVNLYFHFGFFGLTALLVLAMITNLRGWFFT